MMSSMLNISQENKMRFINQEKLEVVSQRQTLVVALKRRGHRLVIFLASLLHTNQFSHHFGVNRRTLSTICTVVQLNIQISVKVISPSVLLTIVGQYTAQAQKHKLTYAGTQLYICEHPLPTVAFCAATTHNIAIYSNCHVQWQLRPIPWALAGNAAFLLAWHSLAL